MKKIANVKYVDMAKWLDYNVRNPNADVTTAYDYLTMLSYMLAVKRKFFTDENDYDDFAYYTAIHTYNRLTTPRQYLEPTDPQYVKPIKSVLNYLKKVLYARKLNYLRDEKDILTPEAETIKNEGVWEYVKSNATTQSSNLLHSDICIEFSKVDSIIKEVVYNGVYGKDKILCYKLYTSVLISLLRNFTLLNKHKNRLMLCYISKRFDYEILLEEMMKNESLTAAVVFDLDKEYLPYVQYLLQKVKAELVECIDALSYEYDITDDMVADILMSDMAFQQEEIDE